MSFSSGSVTFPAAAAWHVNLGAGAPSNIVIADGMIS